MEPSAFCLAFSKCEERQMLSAPHSTAPPPAPLRSHGSAPVETGNAIPPVLRYRLPGTAHVSPTFVVARDPPQAVSKSDFSPDKVSENSDLTHKSRWT